MVFINEEPICYMLHAYDNNEITTCFTRTSIQSEHRPSPEVIQRASIVRIASHTRTVGPGTTRRKRGSQSKERRPKNKNGRPPLDDRPLVHSKTLSLQKR